MRHRFFHDAGALDNLGQKHLAGAKQISDRVHSVHEWAFDDVDGTGRAATGLFNIFDDVIIYTPHECVPDALGNGLPAPRVIDLPLAAFTFE
jgi:hypothetical protein